MQEHTQHCKRQCYSRREFLKLGGATAAALALYRVTNWSPPHAAAAATRHEWVISDGLPSDGAFETAVLWPDERFNALDLSWLSASARGDGLAFWARVSDDGASWSDWIALAPDQHELDAAATRGFTAPLLAGGQALQARVEAAPGAMLRELTIGVIDTSAAPGVKSLEMAPPLIDGFIIARAGWGANEALRYEQQNLSKPVIWPPQYQPIEKVIIHHTVTDNRPVDPAAAVRAIYYYHAIQRGWGDIGYNFLIDWNGNVYEGRYGGPTVVGGHALQYNWGSIGIALLGDFTKVAPSNAMLSSIARMIEVRAPNVDVTTAADFVDLLAVPNLCGHGDVMPTACPGDQTRALLPALRGIVAGTGPIYLAPPVLPEGITVLESQIGPATVYQGNLLEARVRVVNPSAETLLTQGPNPGYIYEQGGNFIASGYDKQQDAYRVCIDFASNSGTVNPYRWGLGSPLAPGEEREIVGYVRMADIGTDTWTVSIVKEFVRYLVDRDYPQKVTVASPPIARAAQSNAAGVRYFAETGHNVPGLFAAHWDASGGLPRFGYPLTEAFEEVSETDGGRYLTQYFERARFEYHPEYAGTDSEVLLGLLGAELSVGRRGEAPFRPIKPFANSADRVFFAETGHSLAYAFKDYWEAQGGLPMFGYPISEEFDELSQTDGQVYTVQYFERNRFEWHPEYAGTDSQVLLGHLAREILIRRGWLAGPNG